MSKSAKSSVFDAADPAGPNAHNQVLRHRIAEASDGDEESKIKINETTVEARDNPGVDTSPDDDVEYVKGHPVIKNGELLYCKDIATWIRANHYDRSRCLQIPCIG